MVVVPPRTVVTPTPVSATAIITSIRCVVIPQPSSRTMTGIPGHETAESNIHVPSYHTGSVGGGVVVVLIVVLVVTVVEGSTKATSQAVRPSCLQARTNCCVHALRRYPASAHRAMAGL